MGMIKDGFANLIARLGAVEGDKNSANTYLTPLLNPVEAENAYRTSWFRKIVDVPPYDMTREWRNWQAEDDQIEAIEKEELRLDLRRKIRKAMAWARLYGGSLLIIGEKGNTSPEMPLDVDAITEGGIEYVSVLARHMLVRPEEIIRDPLSEFFGQPPFYQISGGQRPDVKVHPSRTIRFVGNELPETLSSGVYDGWGDSLWLACKTAIANCDLTAAGVAALVQEAKVDVFLIEGFMKGLGSTGYEDLMKRRLGLVQEAKSIQNAVLLDKLDGYERKEYTFGGLPDVLKVYLMIMSGVCDIPATRLLGKAPDGMNATGDSDLRNYYDSLASKQNNDLTPSIEPLDRMLMRSALGTADVDSIYYEWAPLWQMTPAERSEVDKRKAETTKVWADSGLIPDVALAEAAQNMLIEDGTFPGIEQALEDAKAAGEVAPIEEEPTPEELAAQAGAGLAGEAAGKPAAAGKPTLKLVGADSWHNRVRKKAKAAARKARHVADAAPRPLYVRRDVVNAVEIVEWARGQGFTPVPAGDMHVTLAHSREPVDWMAVGMSGWGEGDERGRMTIKPGGARLVEPLGEEGAIVLLFSSWELSHRHGSIREAGAKWDFDDYQPHVTIAYEAWPLSSERTKAIREAEPYRGKIVLGPEIFEEVE